MNYELRIKNSRGFTLIELLIVIVIIGILSSILLSNFIGVRQRARDGTRKSDLRQIQAALELYRADLGFYPNLSGVLVDCSIANPAFTDLTGNPLGTGSTLYMQKVPCDPSGTGASFYNGGNYYYRYDTTFGTYTLVACLENNADSQGTATPTFGADPATCASRFYYQLSSP